MRDLTEPEWRRGLATEYDVAVAVNSVHWLTQGEAEKLLRGISQLLRPGGVCLVVEPPGSEPVFGPWLKTWREEQPSQHSHENWRRF